MSDDIFPSEQDQIAAKYAPTGDIEANRAEFIRMLESGEYIQKKGSGYGPNKECCPIYAWALHTGKPYYMEGIGLQFLDAYTDFAKELLYITQRVWEDNDGYITDSSSLSFKQIAEKAKSGYYNII